MSRKAIGVSAVVSNIIQAIDRRRDASKSLLFYCSQEIARITPGTQATCGYLGNIETALGGETGFHRRVVKRADHEVSAGMALGSSGQDFILARQSQFCFRPWNVGEQRSGCTQEKDAAESESL